MSRGYPASQVTSDLQTLCSVRWKYVTNFVDLYVCQLKEPPVTQVTGRLQATDRSRPLVVVNRRFLMGLSAWSRAIVALK